MALSDLLQLSAVRHSHLCPRQVLGVRMGIAGLAALGVGTPLTKPTGLVIVETDGCFVDGIEVATGATVGHRTLRVHDMGKVAATFVNVANGRSIRLVPRAEVRSTAYAHASRDDDRYLAQLEGYQLMPDHELFRSENVHLDPPLDALLSRPDVRVSCSSCGEEIINQREVLIEDMPLCQSCAGRGYYTVSSEAL